MLILLFFPFIICISFLHQRDTWILLATICLLIYSTLKGTRIKYRSFQIVNSCDCEEKLTVRLKIYTLVSDQEVSYFSKLLKLLLFFPHPLMWFYYSFMVQFDSFPAFCTPFWVPLISWLILIVYFWLCQKHKQDFKNQNS